MRPTYRTTKPKRWIYLRRNASLVGIIVTLVGGTLVFAVGMWALAAYVIASVVKAVMGS